MIARHEIRRVLSPILLSTLLAAGALLAEELRVDVTVDSPRPALDRVVRVTYTFTGEGSLSQVKPPASLPLKNLVVVGGPSTSTQISFINGVVRKSIGMTFYLRAKEQGPAEIGETVWTLGDRALQARGYALEVGPSRGGRPGGGDEEEDATDPFAGLAPRQFRQPFPQQQQRVGAERSRQALVEYLATPDRTTAYVGEEILIHYELVTQLDVQGLEYVDPPKFPGCWSEDLEKPDRPTGRQEEYQGQRVVRFTLLKKAVSGLTPGTLSLPSARVRLAVRTGGDPFGDPFGMFDRRVIERETKPLSLTILPIPGDPSFTGPVGKFELSAKVDRADVPVGDAVTVKVRLSGTGNLRTAGEPPALSVPGARVYPPTSRSDLSRSGKSTVYTEWSYVVVPARPGELTIPAVSLAVFNPAEKRISTRSSSPIVLKVTGGEVAAASALARPANEAGKTAAAPAPPSSTPATTNLAQLDVGPVGGSDASAPTLSAEQLQKQPTPGAPPSGGGGPAARTIDLGKGTVAVPLWALLAVPGALVVAGAVALALRRQRPRGRLLEALSPEPDETKERVAGRIDRALREWVATRYGLPEGSNAGVLIETLLANGQPADLVEEVRRLIGELDFLRFAPQLGEYGDRIAEARRRAERVFSRLR